MSMENQAATVTVQKPDNVDLKVETKPSGSIFSKAANYVKNFVQNLNPIGKDKAWFGGVVVGLAESLLVSPLIPFPAAGWIKAGINALVANGLSAGINKYYDWKQRKILSGTPQEVMSRINEVTNGRHKAQERIRKVFSGIAAGTIFGLAGSAVEATGVIDTGKIRGSIDTATGGALTNAGERVSQALYDTSGAVGSASDTVSSAATTVENAFNNALNQAKQTVHLGPENVATTTTPSESFQSPNAPHASVESVNQPIVESPLAPRGTGDNIREFPQIQSPTAPSSPFEQANIPSNSPIAPEGGYGGGENIIEFPTVQSPTAPSSPFEQANTPSGSPIAPGGYGGFGDLKKAA